MKNLPSKYLSPVDIASIELLFNFTLANDLFSEDEFQTLIGVTPNEAKLVVKKWPRVDLSDETTHLVVWNILTNLAGYPHGYEDEILKQFGVSSEILTKLRNKLPSRAT